MNKIVMMLSIIMWFIFTIVGILEHTVGTPREPSTIFWWILGSSLTFVYSYINVKDEE